MKQVSYFYRIILSLICQILATIDATTNGELIIGFYDDDEWPDFNVKLWTYTLYSDVTVSKNDVKIIRSTKPKEYVKGLNAENIKTIQYLPIDVYKKFPNLEAYQFRNCSIKELRYENFQNLTEIQYMNLGLNEISVIPAKIFRDLTNLNSLELYDNLFQTIDGQGFFGLENLNYLSLQNNQITLVPEDSFDFLTELEKISLAYNKIEALNDAHFKNNKKITTIWLEMNIIKSLSPSFFDHMEAFDFVNLINNTCIDGFYYSDGLDDLKEKIKNNCQL